MTKTTVNRKDITVVEEQEYLYTLDRGNEVISTTWIATLNGEISTGESVELSRSGDTFSTALFVLEHAISQQGWGII